MIQQAAGRGDQNVDAVMQFLFLRVDVDAAEDHRGLQVQVLAVSADTVLNLGGKLPGRCDHERSHGSLATFDGLAGEHLQ